MTRKLPVLAIYSYEKDRPVTAVKGDALLSGRYVKEVSFVIGRCGKGVVSGHKWFEKGYGVGPCGGASPCR